MNFKNILEDTKIELLTESGIRIPPGTQSFKILHHDDADGLGSAKMARKQIQNQMFKTFKKKYPGKSDKEIRKIIDSRITTVDVTDSSKPEHIEKALQKSPNQMILVVDFDRFDKFGDKVKSMIKNGAINFHSDHHETEKVETRGGGKTGATDFRSDTEHLATKTVSKGVDTKAVLAFSDTDSATFRQSLMKSMGIEKSDNKRLSMISDLFTYLGQFARSKKNPKATELFIKNGGDSLISMYRYAKKLAKAVNLVTKGQGALNRKKDPSQKVADESRNELIKMGFPELAKDIQKGKKTKYIMEPDKLKEKNINDFADRDKYFKSAGKYVVMSELKGAKQPGRYLGFVIPNPNTDDKKFYSMIRSWEGMGFFQMSISPEAPKIIRENINLVKIMKEALAELKKEHGTKWNEWAFDIVSQEMGGHAGITNAPAMGLFGLMPKKMRTELKTLTPMAMRLKSVLSKKKGVGSKKKKEEFLKKIPGMAADYKRYEELKEQQKEYGKKKLVIMNAFKAKMVKKVEEEMNKLLKNKNESLINNIRKNSGMLNENTHPDYPGVKLTDAEMKIINDTSSSKRKKSKDEIELAKLVEKEKNTKDPLKKKVYRQKIKSLRSKMMDKITA